MPNPREEAARRSWIDAEDWGGRPWFVDVSAKKKKPI